MRRKFLGPNVSHTGQENIGGTCWILVLQRCAKKNTGSRPPICADDTRPSVVRDEIIGLNPHAVSLHGTSSKFQSFVREARANNLFYLLISVSNTDVDCSPHLYYAAHITFSVHPFVSFSDTHTHTHTQLHMYTHTRVNTFKFSPMVIMPWFSARQTRTRHALH